MRKRTVREMINEATTAAGMGGVEGFGWIGPLQGSNKTALYRRSLWPSGKDNKNTDGKGGSVVKTPPQGYVNEGQILEWFGETQKHKSPSYDGGKIVKIDSSCMSFPYCSQGAVDKPVKLIGETKESNCEAAWNYITEMSKHAGTTPEELAKKIREKYESSGEYLVSDGEIVDESEISILSESQLSEIDMGGFRLVKQPDGRYYPHFPKQSQMELSNSKPLNENVEQNGVQKVLDILQTKKSQIGTASSQIDELINMVNSPDVNMDPQEIESLSSMISDLSIDEMIIEPSKLDPIKSILISNGSANASVNDYETNQKDQYASQNMDDVESGVVSELGEQKAVGMKNEKGELKASVSISEMKTLMNALHGTKKDSFNECLMNEGYLSEACNDITEITSDDYLVSEMFKSLMANEACGDKMREMYLAHQNGNGQLREANDPCWDSYKQVGMKEKNGKEVPNCVPEKNVNEKQSSLKEGIHDMDITSTPVGQSTDTNRDDRYYRASISKSLLLKLGKEGSLNDVLTQFGFENYITDDPNTTVDNLNNDYIDGKIDITELTRFIFNKLYGTVLSEQHDLPMIDANIPKENAKNAEKENGEHLKDADNSQETQEEKVDNLRNQKLEDQPVVEKIKDIKKGASPADVDLDQPNPAWEERVELEMTTGDSRERDEKELGPKANVGHGKVFGDGEDVSGEREVEKLDNRAAIRNLNRMSGKPLYEQIEKMKNLFSVDKGHKSRHGRIR